MFAIIFILLLGTFGFVIGYAFDDPILVCILSTLTGTGVALLLIEGGFV